MTCTPSFVTFTTACDHDTDAESSEISASAERPTRAGPLAGRSYTRAQVLPPTITSCQRPFTCRLMW